MSYQEPIDCGDNYSFMAASMVEFLKNYNHQHYSCPAMLPESVSSFCEKVNAGLNDRASLEEIAHYRLASDALLRFTPVKETKIRETLTEIVAAVPDIFNHPDLDSSTLNKIKDFFLSLAKLSEENRYKSTITGKKSKYSY